MMFCIQPSVIKAGLNLQSLFAGVISLTENSKFTVCFYEEVGHVTTASGKYMYM